MVEMLFEWRTKSSAHWNTFFPFSTDVTSSVQLDFSSAHTTPARRSSKRSRPQADVDGEGSGNLQKKKRRLRLNLITSRLSRPFATPTTHIVSRGTSRFAIWARGRVLGRDLLRKAAIMNRIRIKNITPVAAHEHQPRTKESDTQYHKVYNVEFEMMTDRTRQPLPVPQKTTGPHMPQSPSPLGLSDFNDDEDSGMFDDPAWEDMENDSVDGEAVYSDFNRRLPIASGQDEDDSTMPPEQTDPSPEPLIIQEQMSIQLLPRIPSSAEILELVNQEERQKEISLAQFGAWASQ